jgi:hypothetical protein
MIPMVPLEYIISLVNWLMSDKNPLWRWIEQEVKP